MDKVQLKIWVRPDIVARLRAIDPSHGALSRIVGELVEEFLRKVERDREKGTKMS